MTVFIPNVEFNCKGWNIKYCPHIDETCHRTSETIQEWYGRFWGHDGGMG